MDYEPTDHVRTGGHVVAAWLACLVIAAGAFGIAKVDDAAATPGALPVMAAGACQVGKMGCMRLADGAGPEPAGMTPVALKRRVQSAAMASLRCS